MNRNEERVREIILKEIGTISEDQIIPEASFTNHLGYDSVDMMSMVMDLEKEFGIEISDGDAEWFEKVQDVYDYINANVNEKD